MVTTTPHPHPTPPPPPKKKNPKQQKTNNNKKTHHKYAIRRLWTNFIQTCHNDRCCGTAQFDTTLFYIDFVSRFQEFEKGSTDAPIILHDFRLIGMKFGILLRRVINLRLILFHLLIIHVRKSYLCDVVKKCTIGLYSDIYTPISFRLGMMTETAKLFI